MLLQISLDGNDIKLTLKDGRKVVDELAWNDEYTLSERLLPNIDALLRKNKISKKQIEKVTTKITKTSGVTSIRIVQTVAKAWNVKIA
jgi:tRNA A37 threonylcarbamoyladenosine modification protein TsaB